jgi:uncharacterized protein involved in cysteine biosynthesis
MGAVIASLLKAIRQLGDPAVVRVLAKSVLITLAIFILGGGGLLYWLYQFLIERDIAYSAELSALAAVITTILAGWLLFRIIALAVLQFFADEIVLAVEKRHYPDASELARQLAFREDAANSLRGAGRALLFNILAGGAALILIFTAIGPAIIFWLVNAILLGRELTDMSWLRHRSFPEQATPVGAFERLALGGAIAALMVVPFANLLAPIIGAAAGTHLVQARMEDKNA